MIDELLPYYERELQFIRQMTDDFAEKYPKVAGRLLLKPGTCEDPHVERLIEAFALLAGRVHRKLDDGLKSPKRFLDVLYPHYLRPRRASQAIVNFSSIRRKRSSIYEGEGWPPYPQQAERKCLLVPYLLSGHPLAVAVTGASVSAVNRFARPACPPTRPP